MPHTLGSEWNPNFTANSVGCEHEVDGSTNFVRDEIADHACAVTGMARSFYQRPPGFLPVDQEAV